MICENTVKRYCKDYWNIANYEEAIADKDNTWDCHNVLGIMPFSGKQVSIKYLKEQGLYYNQPASAFVFMTHFDHSILHNPINEEKALDAMVPKVPKVRLIRCIESGKIMPDTDWRALGFGHAHEVARGWRKSCKGLHFEYVKDLHFEYVKYI